MISLVVQWIKICLNAGDTVSIPGPGRFHMLQSNKTHIPQLLEPSRPRVLTPQFLKTMCLEPVIHNKRSHRNEKSLLTGTRESSCRAARTQHNDK